MQLSCPITPTIAIVGSGPSGCYAAQFLRKQWAGAEITVFDALPVPYGLIRYGIAPDHQGNKAVSRQFDRLFERQQVRFVGGAEIGSEITYAQLADGFDIVVLATGMEADRPLPIPCDAAARIVGAGALMRALNGDPTVSANQLGPVGGRVAVIGNGNVSLDVARMLVAPPEHFTGSDVDDNVLDEVRKTPVRRVEVIGRSAAAYAKFDLAVLRELTRMTGVAITTIGLDSGDESEVASTLRAAQQNEPDRLDAQICFRFDSTPTRVGADHGATTVHVERPAVTEDTIAVDTVITAIGFEPRDDRPDQCSILGLPNVFLTGWRRRGAVGGVAANRRCAQEVAVNVVEAVHSGALAPGKPGVKAFEHLLSSAKVDFDGWRRIDSHELRSARSGRCRTKETQLAVLHALANSA